MLLWTIEEDKSGAGGDSSLLAKDKKNEDDKEKEKKRTDVLAPTVSLPAKRKFQPKPSRKKSQTKKDGSDKRAEDGAPQKKRFKKSK